MRTQLPNFKKVFLTLLLAVVAAGSAWAQFSNGQNAAAVLGQPNFTTNNSATTQTGMFYPSGVAVDPTSGKLFVADHQNSRVLRYANAASFTNGAAAEGVLGKPNFMPGMPAATQAGMWNPTGVAVDAGGNLYVADNGNNRVLRFDAAANKANSANADGVLGQPNFTSSTYASTQAGMYYPYDVEVDAAGNLYVADGSNSRILRFNAAANKANGANADGVLGQPNFTSSTYASTQAGMWNPKGVAMDAAGNLYVADYGNSRVLRFNAAANKANGANADGVLGQSNFTSNGTATSQAGVWFPIGVAVDAFSNLYVGDYGNSRVLRFNAAANKANGANADGVLGQPDFTTYINTTTQAGMTFPGGVAVDAAGNLYVAEIFNNRVLRFEPSQVTPTLTLSTTSGSIGTLLRITSSAALGTVTGVTVNGTAAVVVRSSSTEVVALVMPGTTTGAVNVTTTAGSVSGPVFTVTENAGVYTQQQSFTSSIPVHSGFLGSSVRVSADGNVMAVGAVAEETTPTVSYRGFVLIYTKSGSSWVFKQRLEVPTGSESYRFGSSLAMSADGRTLAVGSGYWGANGRGLWIYHSMDGNSWSVQADPVQTGTSPYGTATSLAMSADGNVLVLGNAIDGGYRGTVNVRTRTGSTWSTAVQLPNPSTSYVTGGGSFAGWAVDISADGSTILVGGPGTRLTNAVYTNTESAAWVYTKNSGGSWIEQAALRAPDQVGYAAQGYSVSLSADGNYAATGGYLDDGFRSSKGAVWIYQRTGTSWNTTSPQKILGGAQKHMGASVALDAKGESLIVGAAFSNFTDFTNVTGEAYQYKRTGSVFNYFFGIPLPPNIPADGNQRGAFGFTASISADGKTALIGAPTRGISRGEAYAFTLAPLSVNLTLNASSGSIGTLLKATSTGNWGAVTGVTVNGTPAIVVSSTSTEAVVLVMPGTTTGAVNVTTTAGSVTGPVFTVTATPHPSVQQGNKLTANDAAATGSQQQGFSVAISADGNTALVGGPLDGGVGTAWVYVRSGTTWTQQGGKLVGPGASAGASFGGAVALSADGNTAIIGGAGDNGSTGAAWIFTRTGATWSPQGNKLVGTNPQYPNMGFSVAISADGNTAALGGFSDSGMTGATWVFVRTNGMWAQQGLKLVGTGAVGGARQGSRIALSADGQTLLIGGPNDDTGIGAAWVFTRTGGSWTQQGNKLVGTGAVSPANQGSGVALSADGNTAIVGGNRDNTVPGASMGAAWVYTRTNGVWAQQGSKLQANDGTIFGHQGANVSLSADGNVAMVGGPAEGGGHGAFWIYKRTGATWAQQGTKLIGTNGAGYAQQGFGVALSADGSTAIEGGRLDHHLGGSDHRGAAWIYVAQPVPPPGALAFDESLADTVKGGKSQQPNLEVASFKVFPNPASDYVEVKVAGVFTNPIDISIVNGNGDAVASYKLDSKTDLQEVSKNVYVGQLQSGLYTVIVNSGTFVERKRLLIVR